MNNTVRLVLGILAGLVVGSIVNISLINISGTVVPLPEGVDPNDIESIKSNIHLYTGKHYIMPFLAHALGTLVGAFVAAKIALTKRMTAGLIIGGFFLVGGVMAAKMIGTPLLPSAVDILLAYIPMGWLGAKLAGAE